MTGVPMRRGRLDRDTQKPQRRMEGGMGGASARQGPPRTAGSTRNYQRGVEQNLLSLQEHPRLP